MHDNVVECLQTIHDHGTDMLCPYQGSDVLSMHECLNVNQGLHCQYVPASWHAALEDALCVHIWTGTILVIMLPMAPIPTLP